MDSVRFSIIENDLLWEEKNKRTYDNDEGRSISSESSGGCRPVDAPNAADCPRYRQEIWEKEEIDKTLRNLPHAELIINKITSIDIDDLQPDDLKAALLLSVWLTRHDCVSRLLNIFQVDPNICDLKGRTALHLSCALGDTFSTRILLRHKAIADCWDIAHKATPLHCAASIGSVDCVQLLLRNGAQVNAGIEIRSALHYAVESNALNCVQTLLQYGASPNTPQVYTETPLHIAATLGFVECMKLLLEHGADVRSLMGKRKLTALHLAVEEDYTECVRLLLNAKANIDARNSDNKTPLHIACLSQSIETVDLLVSRKADVHAIYKDGRTTLHAAIVKDSKDWECARILLKNGVNVNKPDNFGYTPLHMAALNESGSCAYMLIEYGADITARTAGGISALTFIVRRTPEVIPKYLAKFDSSIIVNDHEIGDVDCEIKLDFKLLVPCIDRGETELLLAFIEVGQKRVLKHPLCETFLFLKWRRIRKFFLFSLFFHAVFVLLFTMFMLGVYDRNCTIPCSAPSYVKPIGYIIIFLNFILLLKELFQMAHGFNGYIKYWENWLQWSIIFGVFFCATPGVVVSENLTLIPDWQHHVAALVIFMVWLELMMLVGRFPIFGLYVQMFTKVAVNFCKFFLAYCCLLVAFGLSFGVLFSSHPAFQSVPWSILKTITMMSGELEFEDIFYGDNEIKYPVTSHIMFFAFVMLVTVILTNLLVGLAVSDIQGLQASAGLDRLSRQAELVSRLEGLFFSSILGKCPRHILEVCQKSALLRTSRCHLQFCVKPNDPRDKRLPKDLMLSIYKLVAERRDRNQSIRRKNHYRNLSFFEGSRRFNNHDNEVETRKHSTNYLRNRTVSDNPQIKIKEKSPKLLQSNSTENDIILKEILQRLENNQIVLTKKLDEISNDIKFLKVKMKS